MPRRFLSEREGKQGGGLIDPFVNPERDVELEAARGGAGRLCLRRGRLLPKEVVRLIHLQGLFWDGAVRGLFLVDLHQASFVGGEVAQDCAGGGFCACSCSGGPVYKV